MMYTGTRDPNISVTAQQAIAAGIAPDGGLFVPESIPQIDYRQLAPLDYAQRAAAIMHLFLPDFSQEELDSFCSKAYSSDNFVGGVAPLVRRGDGLFLELWHGPTCAFKDVALQMLPRLLTASLKKTGQVDRALILTATSGDTGKAALEGFRDVEGTKIMVFYPENGVSRIQRLQMSTQQGGNVSVVAVRGNFDDTQTGVKQIFADTSINEAVKRQGYCFSSANSINWGRLLPQIVYYFSAYCDAVKDGVISDGDRLNFCVPTGNFGNILAAYYASVAGLPIGRLICASNANNVLTEFIQTGVYDRNRDFKLTASPSMDILISSNLERLLHHLCGDPVKVSTFMGALSTTGRYAVDKATLSKISRLFWADYSDDAQTFDTIRRVWETSGYLVDTHTAVAESVKEKYFTATGDSTPTVVVSTASPFKFCASVLAALGVPSAQDGGVELLDELQRVTGVEPPQPLNALRHATERFDAVVERGSMGDAVRGFVK